MCYWKASRITNFCLTLVGERSGKGDSFLGPQKPENCLKDPPYNKSYAFSQEKSCNKWGAFQLAAISLLTHVDSEKHSICSCKVCMET